MKVVNFNRRVVNVAGTSVTSACIFGRSAGISRTSTLAIGSWRVLGHNAPRVPCTAPVMIVHGAAIECPDALRTVALDDIDGRDDVLASPASSKVMNVHVQGRPFDVQRIMRRMQVVQRDVQVGASSVLAPPLDVQAGHVARTGCTLDLQGGSDAMIARTLRVLARADALRAPRARFTKITARFTTRSAAFTKIPGDMPVRALDVAAVSDAFIAERRVALGVRCVVHFERSVQHKARPLLHGTAWAELCTFTRFAWLIRST